MAPFIPKDNPIIPVDALRNNRVVWLIRLSTAISAAAYGICLYYTPLFFAFIKSYDPFHSAVNLLPFISTFIGTLLIINLIFPRLGLFAPFYILGGVIILKGAAWQATVVAKDTTSFIISRLALIGGGLGMVFQTGPSVFKARSGRNHARETDFITIVLIL